jgi:hypothetical protein
MDRKKWSDLGARQQGLIVAGAVVQLGLLSAALLDLRKRAPEELNGPKPAWAAACFVNFVGPIAYFVFGRKRA